MQEAGDTGEAWDLYQLKREGMNGLGVLVSTSNVTSLLFGLGTSHPPNGIKEVLEAAAGPVFMDDVLPRLWKRTAKTQPEAKGKKPRISILSSFIILIFYSSQNFLHSFCTFLKICMKILFICVAECLSAPPTPTLNSVSKTSAFLALPWTLLSGSL